MVVSFGIISCLVSKPPKVGIAVGELPLLGDDLDGQHVCDVGVQIGFGPSPPPAPAVAMSSTVPKTNSAEHDDRGGGDPADLDAEVAPGLRLRRPAPGARAVSLAT